MPSKPKALILTAVSTPEQAADEKQSLDTQEKELRAIAQVRSWQVERVLRIPGFSRDYLSWEECAADMLAEGYSAMTDLKRLTESHAYDIFMVRDADRFGRTQALVMQVAETICVRHGLRIYSQMDNQLVEGLQARFWAAMAGLRVASDQDKRKKYWQDGMLRRMQRGLPITAQTQMTHTLIRDQKGEAVQVIVDESKRQFFNDIYTVFVERRIAYQKLEKVLYEDYGYTSSFGEALQPLRLYAILTNPFTHGHSAIHYKNPNNYAGISEWLFKEGFPVPEGVTIFYNTHPAVWTGKQFEDIFAEFQRRRNIQGSASPTRSHKFSGLLVCGECGYSLVYNSNQRIMALRCMSHYNAGPTRPDCSQINWMTEPYLEEWFTARLEQLIQTRDWSVLFLGSPSDQTNEADAFEKLEREMRRVEAQINRLIDDRAAQDNEAVIEMYQKRLTAAGEHLEQLRRRRDLLQSALTDTAQAQQQREHTLDEMIEIGLVNFWALPDPQINQFLHRLMGKRRLVVLDRAIIATRDAPKRQSRKKGKREP